MPKVWGCVLLPGAVLPLLCHPCRGPDGSGGVLRVGFISSWQERRREHFGRKGLHSFDAERIQPVSVQSD